MPVALCIWNVTWRLLRAPEQDDRVWGGLGRMVDAGQAGETEAQVQAPGRGSRARPGMCEAYWGKFCGRAWCPTSLLADLPIADGPASVSVGCGERVAPD